MTTKMKAWIGMDYDRGLTMLKDYVEKGSVPSSLSIDGESRIERQRFVGIEHECTLTELGPQMKQDDSKLYELAKDRQWAIDSPPFAVYHHMDIVSTRTRFVSAIPVSGEVEVAAPLLTGALPEGRVFRVTHTGSYDHLGNAWSAAFNASRNRKVRTKKTPMGYERYLNNPADTPPEALITEILLPLPST
jgi:effector-binding domain-containing protein